MSKNGVDFGTCIFCEELIKIGEKKFVVALDRPYRIDLWVHRECYNKRRDNGTLISFIRDNLYSYLDKYEEQPNVKEKTSKRRGRKTKEYSAESIAENGGIA